LKSDIFGVPENDAWDKNMIRQLAIVLFGLLLSASVAAASLKPGDTAPDFTLQDLSGKKHTLNDLRAKGPALLFFWSTECGFCRVMAPKLQKLHAERSAAGLTVAGIDIDFNMRAQVEEFVLTRKLEYLILHGSLDNADVVEAYGAPGTPTLVVVGRDGRVVYCGHSLDEATRHVQ
jgi:peroxiredoxin